MDRIIQLCYRKIIDANATKHWEKLVFDSSYTEFRLQAQNFTTGTNFTSYAEILRNFPDAAQLAARVSPAIEGYVQQLDGVVPDLLNNIGKRFLRFKNFQFEIINSDIHNSSRHQVALNFYPEPLIWHDTVGTMLLVSAYTADSHTTEEISTNLFQLPPYVNIQSFKSL